LDANRPFPPQAVLFRTNCQWVWLSRGHGLSRGHFLWIPAGILFLRLNLTGPNSAIQLVVAKLVG
jgi:hypothetical protein